jgi:hypothetical protein
MEKLLLATALAVSSFAQAHEINDYPGNPMRTWVCPGPPGMDADPVIEFNKHASSTFSVVITYHSYFSARTNGMHIDWGPKGEVILNGKKCRLKVTPPNAE